MVKKILIWTRITPCTFVPNIQNIWNSQVPKWEFIPRIVRVFLFSFPHVFRPIFCLSLFSAFFSFLLCPNLGCKLKLRVAIIFIFLGVESWCFGSVYFKRWNVHVCLQVTQVHVVAQRTLNINIYLETIFHGDLVFSNPFIDISFVMEPKFLFLEQLWHKRTLIYLFFNYELSRYFSITQIMKFPSMESVLGSMANSIKFNAMCAPKLKVEISIWPINLISYGSIQVVIRLS